MSSPSPLKPAPESSGPTPSGVQWSLAEMDASARGPVLFLFVSALVWLVLASLLGVIASIKLHAPGFLDQCGWMTYGRVRPAAFDAFLYGFAAPAALGMALWLICRLGRTRLAQPGFITLAAAVWNLGVTLGVVSILAGNTSGHETLEMPLGAAVVLFIAYCFIAGWGLVSLHRRQERELYPSLWFILGAFFWFPWIYSTANLLLLAHPVRGTLQSLVQLWFTNNFLQLVLGSLALAGIFYFIPKLIQRPLYSRSEAAVCFWFLFLIAGWTGIPLGTPLPAWVVSASVVAGVWMFVPILGNIHNLYRTLATRDVKVKGNWPLRFVVFASLSYALAALAGVVNALPAVNAMTHFTLVEPGLTQLFTYGFVAMTLFGAIYYIVPLLTGTEWKESLIKAHFWLSMLGTVLGVGALVVGGLLQASAMMKPEVPFIDIVRSAIPWMGLSTLGAVLLLLGHLVLLMNLLGTLARSAYACCGGMVRRNKSVTAGGKV